MVTKPKSCSECAAPLKDAPRTLTCSNNCRQARFKRLRREKEEFIARVLDSLIIEPVRLDGVPHMRVSIERLSAEDRAGLEVLASAEEMDAETWIVENVRETLQYRQAAIDRRRRRRQAE